MRHDKSDDTPIRVLTSEVRRALFAWLDVADDT